MDNKLQKASAIQPSVVQNAERSVYIANCDGGTVNVNYNYPQASVTGEMLMAIQSFSKDYYQLIVAGNEDIFTTNSIVFPADRALREGTVPPELLRTHSVLTDDGIRRMLTLPAIICNENTAYHGNTDPNQKAIYAFVKKIKKCGKEIKIYFHPINFFAQQTLNEYSIDFGIDTACALTELNRSQWHIKKVNLFEAFQDAHIDVLGPLQK